MFSLNLSPTGNLKYNETGIISTAPFNNTTATYDEITEVKFINPTILTNGLIIFKFKNKKTISCGFKRKRLNEAKIVYDNILQLKNNYSQKESKPLKNKSFTPNEINSLIPNEEKVKKIIPKETTTTNIKFCPECGTEIIPNTKFCMNCGTNITMINQQSSDRIIDDSDNQEENEDNSELEKLVDREAEQFNKMANRDYYFSEESKIKGKQLYEDKKQYLINHPYDFDKKGASIFGTLWSAMNNIPSKERKIYTLTGKGKYIEELGNYEEAIKIYEEADALTLKVCAKDIKELTEKYGERDWLYCAKIRQRIRVCQNNILKEKTKKLESEAKELEKINPANAIEIYNQLNELKPGLKKYNKRIEICKKRLK